MSHRVRPHHVTDKGTESERSDLPEAVTGSYATESQHGQVKEGSLQALALCLYPAHSVNSQVLLVWGCPPSTRLPLFSHLFEALTLSSTSAVMLP